MLNGRRPTSRICTGLDTRERYTMTVCVRMYVYHLQIVDIFLLLHFKHLAIVEKNKDGGRVRRERKKEGVEKGEK